MHSHNIIMDFTWICASFTYYIIVYYQSRWSYAGVTLRKLRRQTTLSALSRRSQQRRPHDQQQDPDGNDTIALQLHKQLSIVALT